MCLTPAATNVDVERPFSDSSKAHDDKRSRMNPDQLDKLMFLCRNMLLVNFDLDWEYNSGSCLSERDRLQIFHLFPPMHQQLASAFHGEGAVGRSCGLIWG